MMIRLCKRFLCKGLSARGRCCSMLTIAAYLHATPNAFTTIARAYCLPTPAFYALLSLRGNFSQNAALKSNDAAPLIGCYLPTRFRKFQNGDAKCSHYACRPADTVCRYRVLRAYDLHIAAEMMITPPLTPNDRSFSFRRST